MVSDTSKFRELDCISSGLEITLQSIAFGPAVCDQASPKFPPLFRNSQGESNSDGKLKLGWVAQVGGALKNKRNQGAAPMTCVLGGQLSIDSLNRIDYS
ncbi:hypothetical protein DSO57_1016055 [Entomophthora muscae]|uniref:Uncharacterized protein n=1 Tax=Entomophthora muscae TaxID=34485 RepID=A0ACC2UQH4_9FUNG|nr:hypothetical protein DSO57_1016055 [Entomophthora muscae]